jgi:hypothetical protein
MAGHCLPKAARENICSLAALVGHPSNPYWDTGIFSPTFSGFWEAKTIIALYSAAPK